MMNIIEIIFKMNITLIYNEEIQSIKINSFNELSLFIESSFDIPINHQVIKLNDKIINSNLTDGDLLYIYSQEKIRYSHIQILGEYHYIFKLIIDSGAENNVISHYLAKMLNLTIDTSINGVAKGVGSAKIVGTANCNLKINHQYYNLNFSVMETDIQDLTSKYLVLIGLDFLIPYGCDISFKNKTITVQGEIIPLLNDYEINKYTHPIKVVNPIELHFKQLNLSLDQHVLLKKILNNIITNPNDEKYKLINTNSVSFQKHLSHCTGFMKTLGFVEINKQLKYTNDIDTLSNLIEIM